MIRAWLNRRAISTWGTGSPLLILAVPKPQWLSDKVAWSPVSAATGYDVRIIRGSDTVVQNSLNQSMTSFVPTPALEPGKYRVEVRSRYSGTVTGESKWGVHDFEVFHNPVVMTSSSIATVDKTPAIHWQVPNGNPRFELVVEDQSGAEIYRARDLTGSFHRIGVPLANKEYTVWIRAVFSNGSRSAWGRGGRLAVGTAPVLSKRNNSISWNGILDATNYELWINYTDSKNVVHAKYVHLPNQISQDYRVAGLPKGRYSAWVRAIRHEDGSRYEGRWSQQLVFEI